MSYATNFVVREAWDSFARQDQAVEELDDFSIQKDKGVRVRIRLIKRWFTREINTQRIATRMRVFRATSTRPFTVIRETKSVFFEDVFCQKERVESSIIEYPSKLR